MLIAGFLFALGWFLVDLLIVGGATVYSLNETRKEIERERK